MKKLKILTNGIWKENPIFVMMLGMCSSLAISTSLTNAIGMGMAVTAVLVASNFIISLLRKIIPDEIRIPVFIIIIATLVKCVQLLMNAYTPSLYTSLGVFIPLIVVNCIILGRAESFASKNKPLDSVLDGLGMGIGYTLAVFIIAFFRQIIGTGGLSFYNPFNSTQVFFDLHLFDEYAISLFKLPAGAFLTLGCILAFINNRKMKKVLKVDQQLDKKGSVKK